MYEADFTALVHQERFQEDENALPFHSAVRVGLRAMRAQAGIWPKLPTTIKLGPVAPSGWLAWNTAALSSASIVRWRPARADIGIAPARNVWWQYAPNGVSARVGRPPTTYTISTEPSWVLMSSGEYNNGEFLAGISVLKSCYACGSYPTPVGATAFYESFWAAANSAPGILTGFASDGDCNGYGQLGDTCFVKWLPAAEFEARFELGAIKTRQGESADLASPGFLFGEDLEGARVYLDGDPTTAEWVNERLLGSTRPALLFVPGVAGSALSARGIPAAWPYYLFDANNFDELGVERPGIEATHILGNLRPDLLSHGVLADLLDQLDHNYQPAIDRFNEWDRDGVVDYVPFPYDWRLGVDFAAARLVQELRTACRERGVWLVAHSTGGLVVKRALQLYAAEGGSPSTCLGRGGVVFMATPHYGAPKAIAAAINPDLFFSGWLRWVAQERVIARTSSRWPTVWELMPQPRDVASGVVPEQAREPWFSNLADGSGDKHVGGEALDPLVDSAAQSARAVVDSWSPTLSGLRVFNVFGWGKSTDGSIGAGRCELTDGVPHYTELDSNAHVDELTSGDGTVPAWSGAWLGSTLPPAAQYAMPGFVSEHKEIPNDENVGMLLKSLVQTRSNTFYPHWPFEGGFYRSGPDAVVMATERLRLSWETQVCSPVATEVSYGGESSGFGTNGIISEGIPRSLVSVGASADGFPHQLIAIPQDPEVEGTPEYHFTAIGTGEVDVIHQVPDGTQYNFQLHVQTGDRATLSYEGTAWQLAIDVGGDGSVDKTLVANRPTVKIGSLPRLREGGRIDLDASGETPDGSLFGLEWDSDGGTLTGDELGVDDGPTEIEVEVTLTDSHNRVAKAKLKVSVENDPPVVDAGADLTVPWGIPVALGGSATDGSPADRAAGLSPHWTFGDGSAGATGAAVSHTYLEPGTYEAILHAADKDGATASDTVTVHVIARAASIDVGSSTAPFGFAGATATVRDLNDAQTARLGGLDLSFTAASETVGARTNAAGVATASFPATTSPGSHELTVELATNPLYAAPAGSGRLEVASSSGIVTGALSAVDGPSAAILVHSDGQTTRGQLGLITASRVTMHASDITALGISPDGNSAWILARTTGGIVVTLHVRERSTAQPQLFEVWLDGVRQTAPDERGRGLVFVHRR